MTDIPKLDEMKEQCVALYDALSEKAWQAQANLVREDLPIRCLGPSRFEFLPATSLAIQSLVPTGSDLHEAMVTFCGDFAAAFPRTSESTFWQPPGTFHHNVAVLIRLTTGALDKERYAEALERAEALLRGLEGRPAYDVAFRGIVIAADGTILAKGFPAGTAPFEIRRAFLDAGFPNQQVMCHVTLGRILTVQPSSLWRALLSFIRGQANREFGLHRVQAPILVAEDEGFLHCDSCYSVLREFRWE